METAPEGHRDHYKPPRSMSTRPLPYLTQFSCSTGVSLRGVVMSALLVCVTLGSDLSLADGGLQTHQGLRSSKELDTGRIGKMGADERSLLRLEWRSDISRIDENSLVGDMLSRIGRIETTTVELHALIQAMPAFGQPMSSRSGAAANPIAAATASTADSDEAPPNRLPQYGLAGGAALLLAFWAWRRRAATPSAVAKVRTAVSPAPTLGRLALSGDEDADPIAVAKEKADVLVLADVMLATGLANDAAKTLLEHIRLHPKESLLHWMKLLEVYRKTGNRFQFEKVARELKLNFNVEAENWAQLHSKGEAALENFGRINTRLQELWEQPEEVLAYMHQLLADNRDGDRDGFPQSVAEELMLLIVLVETKIQEANKETEEHV